jgi:parvulin-like peptidyl-prolyl isomerase
MAKKEAQTSAKPTRRQVARSRKEREQLRLFYMGLGLVAVLILIVLAIGLIQTYVIEPNSPVGSVNGVEISTREYQNRVMFDRFVLDDQYQQIAAELSNLGPTDENDQMGQFIRNQYQQYASQILQQRSQADRQAFDNIISARLITAEAASRGLTATEEEVTEAINRQLAGRQGGYTEAAIAETSTAQAEASATAALWTPTPTLTTTQEITPAAEPPPTQTPAIIGATELATEYENWINTISEQTGLTEAQYRQIIAGSVLRQKLRDALAEEVPTSAEQVNVRHILVETEEEAQAVIERLNNGEDFSALAQELSQDTGSAEQGGELDFSPRGSFVPEFEDAAFSLPVGQVSEPIQSQFGWHVMEVLAREERELAPFDYAQAQRAAFDEWLTSARTSAAIEDLWTPDKAPADPLLEQPF